MNLKIISAGTVVLIITLVFQAAAAVESPHYSFYPSKIGANWKSLRHDLLRFSIDMPNYWTLGISGSGELAVALIYPQSINISKISSDYESIEVSRIPGNLTLEQVKKNVIAGMKLRHPNAVILKSDLTKGMGDKNQDHVAISWISKTGIMMIEEITLIKTDSAIRSVTVRCSDAVSKNNKQLHRNIVGSFVGR